MEKLTVIITLNWRAKFAEFTGFAKYELSGNDNKFVKLGFHNVRSFDLIRS